MTAKCCVAGCEKTAVVGVGPNAEPMCQKHFAEWLEASKRTLEKLRELLGGAK